MPRPNRAKRLEYLWYERGEIFDLVRFGSKHNHCQAKGFDFLLVHEVLIDSEEDFKLLIGGRKQLTIA